MDNQPHNESDDKKPTNADRGPLSVIQSVAAAAFGVQSEQKRSDDFQHGKPTDFILYGIVFLIIFIVTLIVVVSNIVD